MAKKRILLVEDEPDYIMMIKMRLEASGYEVTSAIDGEEGLKKAREKPDLVLLDIVMPKVDGLSLCKTLKDNPKTKEIPIIIITASGVMDLAEKCIDAGADDHIIKTCESKELLDKIAKYLK